jgi:hypothetical protein
MALLSTSNSYYDSGRILAALFIGVLVWLVIWFFILLAKAAKAGAIHGHKDKLIVTFLFVFTSAIGGIIFLYYRLKKHQAVAGSIANIQN